jgi:hypothetical protein
MFAMPTNRRILICRVGFVLFCLLPTALTGAWIASRPERLLTGWSKVELQQELSHCLGLIAEIDDIGTATMVETPLTGLRLRDPETGEMLVRAAAALVRRDHQGWHIEARQVEVDARRLRRLIATLHDRLLCGPTAESPSASFAARDVILRDDVILRAEEHTQTLTLLTLKLGHGADGPQAVAEFQLAGAPTSASPISIIVTRNRSTSPPVTQCQLDTHGQSLPCSLVALLLPSATCLGNDAHVTVVASGAWDEAGFSGEIAGSIDALDLDALVTEHFPHQLSGSARVQLEQATIDDGKLVEVRGTLDVGSGSLSSSLLVAAEKHLGLQPANSKDHGPTAATIPFQRLAMGFHLDGRILRIRGLADPLHGRVVVQSTGVPLLVAGTDHAVPAINLLRVLLPDNDVLVPATRQTDALIGLLPVPDLAAARTAIRPTHTPTRLRPTGPSETAPALRPPQWR